MALKIKRALISVSNKIGIVKFAQTLQNFGVEIIFLIRIKRPMVFNLCLCSRGKE